MKETLDRSSLGGAAPGSPVNLERAVTMATRLGGHLVQGHVDGVGTIAARRPAEHWELVEISLPASTFPLRGRERLDRGRRGLPDRCGPERRIPSPSA